MEKRKAFSFLRSYYDVLDEIREDKDKLNYLLAVLDRQFKGVEPDLKGISKLAYVSQQHAIDASRKGWEDKTGYQSPTLTIGGSQGDTEPPTHTIGDTQQEKEKEKEKGKEKEKEKENPLNHSSTQTQFNKLMKLFGEPLKFQGANRREWDNLTAWEKEKAYKNAEDYLKVEQKSLRFYLIDRKWEMDLTIPTKTNKITDPTHPDYDWNDPNNYY